MRTLGFILASAALCLLLAGSALATPVPDPMATGWITMQFTGVSPGTGVSTTMGSTTAGVYNQQVYLDSTKYGNYVDQEASELIGPLSLGTVYGSGTTRYAYAQTFCADFRQYVYTGEWVERYIYRPADAPIGGGNTAMGDTKAANLRRLWDNYSAYGLAGADWDSGGTDITDGFTAAEKNDQAAAFQASVWEIIYGTTPYNVLTDTFRVTSGNTWTGLSNYWLANLGTVDPDIGLRILVSQSRQDFAIMVPGVGRDPIPEPVTMAGLMLGIGCLATYLRRRRRA